MTQSIQSYSITDDNLWRFVTEHEHTPLSVNLLLPIYPSISKDHLQLGMGQEGVMVRIPVEGLVSTFNILLLHNYYQETILGLKMTTRGVCHDQREKAMSVNFL